MFAAVTGGLRHLAGSLWPTPRKSPTTATHRNSHSSPAVDDSSPVSPDRADDPMDVSYFHTPQHPSAMPITPLVSHPTHHPRNHSSLSSSDSILPSPIPFSLSSTQTPLPSPPSRRQPLPSVPLFDQYPNPPSTQPPTTSAPTHTGAPRKGWSIVIESDPAEKENDPPGLSSPAAPPPEAEAKQPSPPSASLSAPSSPTSPPTAEEEPLARKRKRDSSMMVDVGDMDVDEPSTSASPSTPPISLDDDPLYPHSLKKLRLQEEGVGAPAPAAASRERGRKRNSLTSRLRALWMGSYSAMFSQPGLSAQDHLGAHMQRMKLQAQQGDASTPPQPPPQQPQAEQNPPQASRPSSPPAFSAEAAPMPPSTTARGRFEEIKAGKMAKLVELRKKRQAEKAREKGERETERHLPPHKQPQSKPTRRDGGAEARDGSEERNEAEVQQPTVQPEVREEKAREEESRRKGLKESAWDADSTSQRRQQRVNEGVERRKVDRNHSILEKREQQRRREQEVREQREREEREAAEREERRLEAERVEAEANVAEERRRQQRQQEDDAALQRAKAQQAETAAREAAQRAAAVQAEQRKDSERAKPRPQPADDVTAPRRSSRLSALHPAKASDDDSIHSRLQARRLEQAERERREEAERVERERLHPTIERQVRARARGKDYVGLVREFSPQLLDGKSRVVGAEVRKVLRRCMAQFHPDKQVTKPLKERIECEEIFAHIKKAYEELP